MPVVASPIPWAAIEDALIAWMAGATGLTAIWAQQDAPQPAYPYATLNVISGPRKVAGPDELRFEGDAYNVVGLREMTLSCQIHVRLRDEAALGLNPATHSRNLMSRAQGSLGLPSVLAALRLAGLSVISEGPIQNISEVVEDTWVSRAQMDVRLGLASNALEPLTDSVTNATIKKARLSGTTTPPTDPDVAITDLLIDGS